MTRCAKNILRGAAALLTLAAGGCGIAPTSLFTQEFINTVTGRASTAASLPGLAPSILVTVQNSTTRYAQLTVSYRDTNDSVKTYTTNLAPGDDSATLLACPIKEITLGSVSDLTVPGAVVFLQTPTGDAVETAPFVSVEPFGVLLRESVNYSCGDGLKFQVAASNATRSGYQTFFTYQQSSSSTSSTTGS